MQSFVSFFEVNHFNTIANRLPVKKHNELSCETRRRPWLDRALPNWGVLDYLRHLGVSFVVPIYLRSFIRLCKMHKDSFPQPLAVREARVVP